MSILGILFNGEQVALEVETLGQLLAERGIFVEVAGVAVAVNGRVIHRPEWDRLSLSPGDEIEVVGAVQGG